MQGKFWMIDEDIYNEFLEMLPPRYCSGGFRMSEKLTGNIAATFLQIGAHYWCGYTDDAAALLNHILKDCYK